MFVVLSYNINIITSHYFYGNLSKSTTKRFFTVYDQVSRCMYQYLYDFIYAFFYIYYQSHKCFTYTLFLYLLGAHQMFIVLYTIILTSYSFRINDLACFFRSFPFFYKHFFVAISLLKIRGFLGWIVLRRCTLGL